MRQLLIALALLLSVSSLGCNILEGYYTRSKHFRFGLSTAADREFSSNLDRTLANLKVVLKNHRIHIKDIIHQDEVIQVWGTNGSINYVFDLSSRGEGCLVHVEMDQAGADGITWKILHDLEMLP